MMANAQKMIQERKAQLEVTMPTPAIPNKPAQSPQVKQISSDRQNLLIVNVSVVVQRIVKLQDQATSQNEGDIS